MPVVAIGYDCSWDPPDQVCMVSLLGARFIVRYASRDPSKNLTQAELDSALSNGLAVCVVWQEGKTQMLRGWDGGIQDANDAEAFVNGLGLGGIPIYFACDDDITFYSNQQIAAVDNYVDATRSVVGNSRNGGYGSFDFCKRELDRGAMVWGWQTYGWSGDRWEERCQLRQVNNNVTVCGGTIDWDEARYADYGQWPRPSGTVEPAPDDDEEDYTAYPAHIWR